VAQHRGAGWARPVCEKMDSFAQPDVYGRLSEPKLTGAESKVVAAIRVLSGQKMKNCEMVYGKEEIMLWTIFVILLVLWLLGLATSYTVGGLIHILLVLALIVLVIRLIQGRRLA
jgi:uncharacterized protein DUF5670